MKKYSRSIMLVVIGIVCGFIVSSAVRFVAYSPEEQVHYHANFAVFINGEQQLFEGPGYYEEVQACTDHHSSNPRGRTHMHDNKAGLIHVHDNRVTWGNFFENIGWALHDTTLISRNGDVYQNDKSTDNRLTFWLNGEKYTDSLANTVIESEDQLLVSYGSLATNTEDVQRQQLKAIPTNAAEANTTQDPSSCQGTEETGFGARLKAALLLQN